ncbi:hypothetical protein [Methylosinus sp. Sm6]|uniref:hypothetical protein n=1 Tax=Methylosinus sp. Sm6 TaxID=2866948 RepID=UPI001C99614F|nr:hypothetical protein [Methylosinus sp. Sm6]MBY6240050.1 hypothetical protein [Methylosinus sp. Sm6]
MQSFAPVLAAHRHQRPGLGEILRNEIARTEFIPSDLACVPNMRQRDPAVFRRIAAPPPEIGESQALHPVGLPGVVVVLAEGQRHRIMLDRRLDIGVHVAGLARKKSMPEFRRDRGRLVRIASFRAQLESLLQIFHGLVDLTIGQCLKLLIGVAERLQRGDAATPMFAARSRRQRLGGVIDRRGDVFAVVMVETAQIGLRQFGL